MLYALTIRPPLTDLHELISRVPRFPVNNRQLVEFAAKVKAPKEVIDFYRTFDDGQIYKTKDELATISEQVDLMRQDESEMPADDLAVPQED